MTTSLTLSSINEKASSRQSKRTLAGVAAALLLAALVAGAPTASAEYFVVVGSFLDQSVATEELRRRGDRSGNTLRIAATELDDQVYYRLISGPFVSPRTALAEQLGWQSIGISDAWVVQLNDVPLRRSGMELARN